MFAGDPRISKVLFQHLLQDMRFLRASPQQAINRHQSTTVTVELPTSAYDSEKAPKHHPPQEIFPRILKGLPGMAHEIQGEG